MKRLIFYFSILIIFIIASCRAAPSAGQTLQLASETENHVKVEIALNISTHGQTTLSATFTPDAPGLHLYSKDTPKAGVDNLGRPTLLELSNNSILESVSELIESASPRPADTPPLDLLTYPAGPVTLSMHVLLPEGAEWLEDSVFVTYMACDDKGCRPPVEGKAITIKIPGKDLIQQ